VRAGTVEGLGESITPAVATPQTDPQVVYISGKQRPQEVPCRRWIVQAMARKARARTHVHGDG
jgi:hypothetical protein